VSPLDHAIALPMVGYGGVVVGADDVAGAGPQLGPQVRLLGRLASRSRQPSG